MALSDYEKQVLTEIEADLSAEDPRWAKHMSWSRRARSAALRALAGALGVVALGITTLAWGLSRADGTGELMALIGYALIVCSVGWLVCAACARFTGRNPRHG